MVVCLWRLIDPIGFLNALRFSKQYGSQLYQHSCLLMEWGGDMDHAHNGSQAFDSLVEFGERVGFMRNSGQLELL